MKIKLTTLMAGPKGVFKAGDVMEGAASDLQPLVDGGYAVVVSKDTPVTPKSEIEEAVEPEVKETATTRKRSTRRG